MNRYNQSEDFYQLQAEQKRVRVEQRPVVSPTTVVKTTKELEALEAILDDSADE